MYSKDGHVPWFLVSNITDPHQIFEWYSNLHFIYPSINMLYMYNLLICSKYLIIYKDSSKTAKVLSSIKSSIACAKHKSLIYFTYEQPNILRIHYLNFTNVYS